MCEMCEHMIDHNRNRRDESGRIMSDSEIERSIDRIVWRKLSSDSAYQNAANAEEAQEREDEIVRQVEADMGRYGKIADWR